MADDLADDLEALADTGSFIDYDREGNRIASPPPVKPLDGDPLD